MTYEKIDYGQNEDPDLLADTHLDESIILSYALTDEIVSQTKNEDEAEEIIKPYQAWRSFDGASKGEVSHVNPRKYDKTDGDNPIPKGSYCVHFFMV